MVHLIERLEKRARELDQQVRRQASLYDWQAAEDRALLEEAAIQLKTYSDLIDRIGTG